MIRSSILSTAFIFGLAASSACSAAESGNDNAQPSAETAKAAQNAAARPDPAPTAEAQTKTIELFDGRKGALGHAKLTEVDLALVEADVRKRSKEPFLTERLGTLGQNVDWKREFKILDVAEGSFTKPGAAGQRAVLYRYSYTNGVVILSDGDIVAHYSGGPGDYAFYTAIRSLPDVNKNGLSELIMFRNVEDNDDIIPYLFEANGDKIKFLGEAGYFASSYIAGDDTDSEKAEQVAYRVSVEPSKDPIFFRDIFERTGSKGEWKLKKKAEKFSWTDRNSDGIYDLAKI